MNVNNWLLGISALAVTYVFAQALSNLNEHFDGSHSEIVQAQVVAQQTRYTPFPIRVATVSDDKGTLCRVDVLPALAFSLSKGDSLSVVKKRGWFGKPWLQDEERFESLVPRRRLQGTVWVAVAVLLSLSWIVVSVRLRAVRLGVAALGLSLFLAYLTFRWLL